MSTSPVTLDFSKAQPINSSPAPAAASQSNGVTLDFSKAQPLYPTAPPTNEDASTTGQMTDEAGKTVIVPKEGESFDETMSRAVEQGKKTTPQDIQDEMKGMPGKVAETMAAAPAIGFGGTAAIAGAGEVGNAVKAVGAGAIGAASRELQPIVDAIKQEFTYLQSSPDLYLEHIGQQAIKWVTQNPGKALNAVGKVGTGAVIAAAVKWLLSNKSKSP